MSIEETITADQAAVTAAQTALDAANATLAADQAKLAAIQPHLDLLSQVRGELQSLKNCVSDAVLAVEANIEPLIDRMVELLKS